MPRQKTSKILLTALVEHPAFKAWSELQPNCVEPQRIEILKRTKKSTVYRLVGVGPEGTTVIAKRSVHSKASVERAVYEEILPHLSISSIRYYGFVEEDDGQYDWLFLASADGNEYSGCSDKHRTLSAQWLASLHTSAVRVPAAKRLPGRGPDHYLEHLEAACDKIVRNLNNPALDAEDVEVLKSVVSQCDILRSHWSEVEELCAGMPQTLIHGDFSPKNMRVQTEQAGIALQVFDWGTAGWGFSAADLVQSARPSDRWASPNLEVYYFVVRESWPHLNIEAIQRLATAGKIFRALVRLNGDARSLKSQWAEWTIGKILVYQSHIDDAIRAAGFGISS